jgi:hypothetical protein
MLRFIDELYWWCLALGSRRYVTFFVSSLYSVARLNQVSLACKGTICILSCRSHLLSKILFNVVFPLKTVEMRRSSVKQKKGLLAPGHPYGWGIRTPAPADRFSRCFSLPRGARVALNVTSIRKNGRGADAQPAPGGGDKARQQEARRKMQHPIYFWNIKMQHLLHTSEGRWNTWNMHLKHLQKHLKPLKNHCKTYAISR